MSDYTPTIPAIDYAGRLLTYQDAVETVLDRYDRPANKRDLRLARRAVLDAYDELPRRHEWTWLSRWMNVAVSPVYDTGTVAFDLTGGTYERELTLSDGVWPSDAKFGYVVIDNENWYAVEDRKSDTVVTLRADSCPSADVAAEEEYWWMREAYPLPPDFWQARTPLDTERGSNICGISELSPSELLMHNRRRGKYVTVDTGYYAFGSDERIGALCLLLGPPLDEARTLTIPYQSMGRRLQVYCEKGGTIAITANTAVVTGTSTAFDQSLVGTVFRVSPNSRLPTSPSGGLDGDYNPPVATRLVKSVTNTTSLTLDSAVTDAVSGQAYTASDPIDIEPAVMGNAFAAMVDYHFIRAERGLISDERSALIRQSLQQVEGRELLLAKDADNRSSAVPPSPIWGGGTWAWPFQSLGFLPPG